MGGPRLCQLQSKLHMAHPFAPSPTRLSVSIQIQYVAHGFTSAVSGNHQPSSLYADVTTCHLTPDSLRGISDRVSALDGVVATVSSGPQISGMTPEVSRDSTWRANSSCLVSEWLCHQAQVHGP